MSLLYALLYIFTLTIYGQPAELQQLKVEWLGHPVMLYDGEDDVYVYMGLECGIVESGDGLQSWQYVLVCRKVDDAKENKEEVEEGRDSQVG